MAAIPNVGLTFPTAQGFLQYLESLAFKSWRPRFVTVHHTGSPSLADWRRWQVRKTPVTDTQWLKNLAAYYGNERGWSAGPHFFFTPKHYCVLSPPTARGIHAASFNATSWGVEMVGEFDSEPLTGELRERYVVGLACLHVAMGFDPAAYVRGSSGLHFHRDDLETQKTCPGLPIRKPELLRELQASIAALVNHDGGEAPAERIDPAKPAPVTIAGRVVGVALDDTLNVRDQASGKAPVVATLPPGAAVKVTGEAMNGSTRWLSIDLPGDADGWIAARFVKLAA